MPYTLGQGELADKIERSVELAIESEILAPDIYCWALFMLEPKNLVRQSFKKLEDI